MIVGYLETVSRHLDWHKRAFFTESRCGKGRTNLKMCERGAILIMVLIRNIIGYEAITFNQNI